ncbi:small integral membrane protein 29-like isoform X1 [Rhincodon typus]|uniref:small integral membrane protein 29-like isoform X1 n=1 Tax=Rhincodon typus TaxID=259920 RepID=UPI00202E38FC|nr:small integral membrane protein 29-like isoform X1 [Rhincodon typus]XP_048463815.1 small integral membrane protein 29-like isoform X1 [Rhincodon typus]XP_048463816.1 small integral membrane protein 29-like isoform X1 [Rhincodon typus]
MPNQTASTPSDSNHSASILGFMLIPVIVIAVIGIAVVVIKYVRKRRRLEKLRNKLVPIYSYDPSEDRNDVEEESLDRSGEVKVQSVQRFLIMQPAHSRIIMNLQMRKQAD